MKGGYGSGKSKGAGAGCKTAYNHSSASSNNNKGYSGPKPIGAKVGKPSPDMKTPATLPGKANGGK